MQKNHLFFLSVKFKETLFTDISIVHLLTKIIKIKFKTKTRCEKTSWLTRNKNETFDPIFYSNKN